MTYTTKLSITVSYVECNLLNLSLYVLIFNKIMLTRFFRPGALPLVMPFNVSLPPGVVILPNFYVIDLPLYKLFLEKQPIVYRQDTVLVVAKFASDFNKVLVEIEFISPIISDWFFGLYFTAFNEVCIFVIDIGLCGLH